VGFGQVVSTAVKRTAVLSAVAATLLLAAAFPVGAGAQAVYLAFGDSITLPGEGGISFDDDAHPCPQDCGYPGRLEDMLQAAGMQDQVINEGKGGDNTVEALSRLPAALDASDPDVMLLMLGTNDISNGISLNTTIFNLDRMAEIAAGRGASTTHATIIPRIPDANQGDGDNVLTQRMNWRIRELAWETRRELADPFEVFLAQDNLFATYYSSGGDAVGHPNPAGFQLLADIFFDVVTGVDSVPPVPGLVEPVDGADSVAGMAQVRLRLYDFGAGIDIGDTDLLINNQPVAASVTGDPRRIELRFTPTTPFPGVVDVGYRAVDLAPARNTRTRTLATFTTRGASFVEGDLNEDGRVDGLDLIALARSFGSSNGESRYQRYVDINRDNRVDGEDLAILAQNFGRSS
jgi:lysophospholipase L1-like esterase